MEPNQTDADLTVEPALGVALFRAMRGLMFDPKPSPELDALPLAQLRLLHTVNHLADATMKDFSERLGVSQSTVTQLADRLVRRDMIERLPDPADRRVVRLKLSDTGRAILGEADAARRRTLYAVWNTLSPNEQETIMDGLDMLGARVEQVRADQGHPLPPPLYKSRPSTDAETTSEGAESGQPVLDLMTRRVRGRLSGP